MVTPFSWRRCLTTVALAASIASGRAAAAPPEPDGMALLEACDRSAAPGGTLFQCKDMMASIQESDSLAPQEFMAHVMAGIEATVTGKIVSSPAPFENGKGQWPGLRFSLLVGTPPRQTFGGQVAASQSGRVVRVVVCGTGGRGTLSEACRRIIPALMNAGAAAVAVKSVEPRFLGVPVPVPEGCKLLESSGAAFRIECAQSAILIVVDVGDEPALQKTADTLERQLLTGVARAKVGASRPCQVGPKHVQCKAIDVGTATDRATFFIGAASLGTTAAPHRRVVICGQPATQVGTHPVCRPVLTLGPPK